jgi:diacylglycerol kinase family enzyme
MYHFILNPNASSGKGKEAFNEIKPILSSRNIDYRLYIFENRDELAETVSALSSSTSATVNHIVVVGGDGTLNLVLNYIEDFTKVKLSVLRW